ncbi:MAG: hypothetical protein JO061_05340 [Acidobacteriaceae bacterium]|nr:hypothetical protein [Acidobacteriaceae bacterium]
MNTTKGELANFKTLRDLKGILASEGPCISIYMPLSAASTAGLNPRAKQNELHWKECVRSAEELADRHGAQARGLLNSISNWAALGTEGEPQGRSIAVFRSPDVFSVAWLEEEVGDRAVVGPRFYIRPMLTDLTMPRAFYLLALSQKDVRLLRCTTKSSEEVPLPASTKTNFESWMNQVKPDHNDRNNASVGPSGGFNGKVGALAPWGSDREAKDQYLSHFFKQVDRGVQEALRGRTEPLVIAGVEYELPLYREVNAYPHLLQEAVQGAANSLKAGEMHARALEAIEREYNNRIEEQLAEWNHKVGANASSRLKEVVTAAHDGRVLTLLVSDSLETTGVFDEAKHKVVGRETGRLEDQDLINDAVVETVLHAGNVLVVPHSRMPNGAPLAAIFRFQAATVSA